MKSRLSRRSLWVVAAFVCVLAVSVAGATAANQPATKGPVNKGLKKGLKVFVIPKNLGNSYFTTADSVKTGGAYKVDTRRQRLVEMKGPRPRKKASRG